MANLLQVSSALGRSMETLDRLGMSKALYPVLLELRELSDAELDCAIAAGAEGYPFPTNLDLDPPLSGLAPPSQQDLLRKAVKERWSPEAFCDALDAQARKRLAH
eukprot:gnl/TRDRNA2_/TRDRNA2_167558_c0_seq1.p1 gnl/TRDRNA2_/TRDRNA2_167558_c0~~gnl/TRDRNA2_/TRDRNA2_167558_c0_seq1.p1  ORF type:complete len:105 (-),score=18.23 gnl/TRDRNA2_/TRDRNA2_167558_c0_seq1:36-350(-)